MKRWVPCGYMVLVKPDQMGEAVTKGGIVIATEGNRSIAMEDVGTIVAVGPNAWKAYDNGEPWAKVGDRITYARAGGKVVKQPGSEDKLILIADGDVRLVEEEYETV
ncbi:MAG: hypothetical protein MN733_26195 [Nitrososphaera sp.]|nr:hypothetical protein [Nitrososphaera sp.]